MRIDLTKPLNKTHAILAAVLVTLIVFFAALIVSRSADSPLKRAQRLNITSTQDVQVLDNCIYYLEAGSLHCVTSEGNYEWNVGVDKNSSFRVSGKGVAVWSGSRLRIVNRETGVVVGSVSASGEIISAVVGDMYAAAVLGPEHDSTVLLTDLNGNTVDTLTDFNEVTVLDCGFFEGRELFWIMTLDSTGSLPTCKISTFKPGKRETGTITDMEQVIYKVMFRSSFICAVGTSYMRVYDYTGSERTDERTTVYGWYLETCDTSTTDNPLMLFVPNSQAGETIQIKDIRCLKGNDEMMLHFPVVCSQLMCRGTLIYGFAGNRLVVGAYGRTGSNVYELPGNLSVDRVIGITDDMVAVAVSGSSVYMIQLPLQ